ncbi:putative ATP-dependent RNA helicase DDX4 [Leptodactylus fuscus]|uniref:putative ATP-dependent RNA helicase DDX4 n=1 Tax=Leptodactylus fuscus TaxID=238119 RepID=UPI003F4E5024
MADEDWENELDNAPRSVPHFTNSAPDFSERFGSSFSTSHNVNENFTSTDRGFGSQKDDNINQNYEPSGRGFTRQRGRSDRGRGGNNNTRGFESFDSQERTGFSNRDEFSSVLKKPQNLSSYIKIQDSEMIRTMTSHEEEDLAMKILGQEGEEAAEATLGDLFSLVADLVEEVVGSGEKVTVGALETSGEGNNQSFIIFKVTMTILIARGALDEQMAAVVLRTEETLEEEVTILRGSKYGGYRGRNEDVGVESGKGQDDLGRADTGPKVTYVPPPPPDSEDDIFRHYQTGINFDKYDEILVDVSGVNAPLAISSFEEADLSDTLTKNVYKAGYVKLTPIQKHSIPIILAGRDLMACAQTGSGKTAAFLLPILSHMMKNGIAASQFKDIQEPEAIIVAPTRELINQIYLDARKFAYGTVVRPVVIYGGTQTSHSLRQIFQGCNILCATPGRLLDIVGKEKIGLSKVKYFVLDEADRMLDMGFMEDVRKLLNSPGMPSREERQTLMFSATFPVPIQNLAREILKPDYLFVVVGQVGGACSDVEQQIIEVDEYGKRDKLLEILQHIGHERTMVFVKTKKKADFIATVLCLEKIPSTSIHGDREQREREQALRDFRSGHCPVIVATSVAARGLDIENVLHVINFDIPGDIDEYVHRIGRTGRCGNTGKAISFFDRRGDDEQRVARALVKVLTDARQEVPPWLEEIAFSAHGMQSYSSNSSNFASVDNRKRGGFQEDDSSSTPSITRPAAQAEEEEDWG